jgi:hypothetical protein
VIVPLPVTKARRLKTFRSPVTSAAEPGIVPSRETIANGGELNVGGVSLVAGGCDDAASGALGAVAGMVVPAGAAGAA